MFDRLSISRPETFISREFLRHFGPLSHTPALSKYPRMSKIRPKSLCTSLNLKSEARIKVPKCKSWPNPFLWNRTNPMCYGIPEKQKFQLQNPKTSRDSKNSHELISLNPIRFGSKDRKVPKCKNRLNSFLWNRTNPFCYGIPEKQKF